jgi:hypothetical protein
MFAKAIASEFLVLLKRVFKGYNTKGTKGSNKGNTAILLILSQT